MLCPKCMRDQFVVPIGETHYICINNSELSSEETGCGAQFQFIQDSKIQFPHNIIYGDKGNNEFFRKPYLQI